MSDDRTNDRERYSLLLPEYFDGTLTQAAREEVEAFMLADADFRAEAEELRSVFTALRTTRDAEPPPRGYFGAVLPRVRARIDAAAAEQPVWYERLLAGPAIRAASAIGVLVVLMLIVVSPFQTPATTHDMSRFARSLTDDERIEAVLPSDGTEIPQDGSTVSAAAGASSGSDVDRRIVRSMWGGSTVIENDGLHSSSIPAVENEMSENEMNEVLARMSERKIL